MSASPSPAHRGRTHGRPPTAALLLGLMITLAMVVAYSWYISRQISGLRRLQTELTDRNRRDSLQLLRIQNDLNQLALAMRDMLDRERAVSADRLVGAVRSHPPRSGRCAEAAGRRWRWRGGRPSSGSTCAARSRSSGTPPNRIFDLARAGARSRGARPDPAVAAGAAGGAQHRRRAAAGAEQRERGADRAAGAGDLRPASSGRCTGSWPRRSPPSPRPACI